MTANLSHKSSALKQGNHPSPQQLGPKRFHNERISERIFELNIERNVSGCFEDILHKNRNAFRFTSFFFI